MGIKCASKAEEIFSKHTGCEINVALCKNILGGACVQLQQFELAEEYFTSAIDILQKQNEETLILRVRNNLGWLYASQNLSSLAIRHLSEKSLTTSKLFSYKQENILNLEKKR